MKEKEVNLGDLLIEMLLHWRGLVLAMLISGIAMGGWSYVKSARSFREQDAKNEQFSENTTDEEWVQFIEELQKDLTDKQLNNVNYVLYYEEQCNDKIDYQQKSILMQLDPNNVFVAEATFLVMSDDLEQTYHYEKAYESAANGVELQEELAEQVNVPVSYINEIYSVSNNSTGKQDGSVTFKIRILHYEEEASQALMNTIIRYIESTHQEMEKIWGTHEIVVLNQSVAKISSKEVYNLQINTMADIRYLQSCAANIKEILTDKEWDYYNLLMRENLINEETIVTPRVNVKYVLVVVILIAFIYAFIIFLFYLFNNKIRATDRLNELYDIPHLGQIPSEYCRKKLFCFIDNWFLTLRDHSRHKFNRDEALTLAATAVKMVAKKERVDCLYFIGCDLGENVRNDYQKIKDVLTKDNLSVFIIDNVLYDVESREKIENIKSVVLLEKVGVSLYDDIAQELALLERQEIKVLGGIVIE